MSEPMMKRCVYPIFMEQPELWGDAAAIGRAARPEDVELAYAAIWRKQQALGFKVGTTLTDRVITTLPARPDVPQQLREIAACLKVEPGDLELESRPAGGEIAVHLKGWHPTFRRHRAI
jgi:hypothetical protein